MGCMGDCRKILPGHGGMVTGDTFSPDGRVLVSSIGLTLYRSPNPRSGGFIDSPQFIGGLEGIEVSGFRCVSPVVVITSQ